MTRNTLHTSSSLTPPDFDEHDLLIWAVRNNFMAFAQKAFEHLHAGRNLKPNWHHYAIAHQLDRVARGEINRLLITIQPRALKSLLVSVMWPAWLIGRDPSRRFIAASYSQNLSEDLAQKFRLLLEAPFYQEAFPDTVLVKTATHDLKTSLGGGRFSTSVGGTALGRGGDIAILDDPQKSEEAATQVGSDATWEWIQGTFFSRLDDKASGAIVVVMQRLHENDVAGRLLRADTGWVHLDLPSIAQVDEVIEIGRGVVHERRRGEALDPRRESIEQLERIEREIGGPNFSAQYLQRPESIDGNIIKRDYFRRYDVVPEGPGRTVISCDLAISSGPQNDYSVMLVTRVIGNAIYVLDVWRKKVEYPDQRQAIVNLAKQYRATSIIIEKAANGSALWSDVQRMGREGVVTPQLITVREPKEVRLKIHAHRVKCGDLYLPRNAPWVDDFIAEVVAFPQGRYDDQVDALSLLLGWRRNEDPDVDDALYGWTEFYCESQLNPGMSDERRAEEEYYNKLLGWHEPTDHLASGPA